MALVLVVDDDADARAVIESYLTKMGHAVTAAENGRAALTALGATTVAPDVVVLDLMMPCMSGLDFLRVIRGYLRWAKLPVILTTAYPDAPELAELSELGVKHIFAKGVYALGDLWQCVNAVAANPDAPCGGNDDPHPA
jgi:CheY-like chemotaxis protein